MRFLGIQENLVKLVDKINEMSNVEAKYNYSEILMQVSHSMELDLANYIQSGNQLLNSIQAATEGRLHPMLLTSKQLERIFRDIHDHAPHLNFPWSGPSISLGDLTRIATTTITVSKGKLRMTLDIPLMDKGQNILSVPLLNR